MYNISESKSIQIMKNNKQFLLKIVHTLYKNFKRLGSVRLTFLKEVSCGHEGWINLLKNTVKTLKYYYLVE